MNIPLKLKPFRFEIYTFSRYIVVCFYALVLLSSSISQLLMTIIPPSLARLVDEMLFAALIGFIIFVIFATKKVLVGSEFFWTIIFSLVAIVTSLVNQVDFKILLLGFLLIIKPLIIFHAYQLLPLNARNGIRLINNLVLFFMVVVTIAVLYSLLIEKGLGVNYFPQDGTSDFRLGMQAARSFFVHASPFSSTMTFAIFIFFARLFVGEGKAQVNIIFILAALVGVLLTLRLKTLILLPVGVVLEYLLIYFRNGRIKLSTIVKTLILFVISLLFLAVSAYLFRDILIFRLSPGTASVRTVLLRTAMLINLKTYGFGVGLGMFGSSVSVNYHYSQWYYFYGIHNLSGATPQNSAFITDQWWSWYLGEVGIIGTAVFLGVLFIIIKKLNTIAKLTFDTQKGLSSLAYGALASLMYGILAGFAGVYLSAPPTGYLAMSLAGITFAVYRSLNFGKKNHLIATDRQM